MATPGWQQRWLENFTANQTGGMTDEDLVMDGWTDLSRRIRSKIMALPAEGPDAGEMMEAFEDSDFEKMEEIRARIDSVVEDQETGAAAQGLVPPAVQAPVLPRRVPRRLQRAGHLPRRHRRQGRRAHHRDRGRGGGREYEVDCIIYASGFEVGTEHTRRAGFDMTGRGGVKLSEHWAEGMRTLHGIHVHGFPNAFLVQPTQGANLISNIPHNLTESGRTIATVVASALERGCTEVEGHEEAEDAWVALLLTGVGRMLGSPDCTPGYYNNEGHDPGPRARLNVGHPEGADGVLPLHRRVAAHGDVRGPLVPLRSVAPRPRAISIVPGHP
jgi:cyclohexanone monooxygenase